MSRSNGRKISDDEALYNLNRFKSSVWVVDHPEVWEKIRGSSLARSVRQGVLDECAKRYMPYAKSAYSVKEAYKMAVGKCREEFPE